jgi:hypothetical protein
MGKTGEQKNEDVKRIDISTEALVEQWARELNCSKTDLVRAVIQVGNSFIAVDAYLEMNRRKRNYQ